MLFLVVSLAMVFLFIDKVSVNHMLKRNVNAMFMLVIAGQYEVAMFASISRLSSIDQEFNSYNVNNNNPQRDGLQYSFYFCFLFALFCFMFCFCFLFLFLCFCFDFIFCNFFLWFLFFVLFVLFCIFNSQKFT